MSKIEEYLDRLLFDFLDNNQPARGGNAAVPLRFFDGAEPLTSAVPGFDEYLAEAGLEDYQVPGDATLRDLDRPLDMTVVTTARREEGPARYLSRYMLMRCREVRASQVRGHVLALRPRMIEMTTGIPTGGTYDTVRLWYGGPATDFARWQMIGPNYSAELARGPKKIDQDFIDRFGTFAGLQFARDLHWRVSLGYDNLPSLAFPTDPLGAREIFRLRDAPPGKTRRAALLHWVKAHWRRKRNTEPAELVKVTTHLRGQETFVWNGLRCTVQPSVDDMKKAGKT